MAGGAFGALPEVGQPGVWAAVCGADQCAGQESGHDSGRPGPGLVQWGAGIGRQCQPLGRPGPVVHLPGSAREHLVCHLSAQPGPGERDQRAGDGLWGGGEPKKLDRLAGRRAR